MYKESIEELKLNQLIRTTSIYPQPTYSDLSLRQGITASRRVRREARAHSRRTCRVRDRSYMHIYACNSVHARAAHKQDIMYTQTRYRVHTNQDITYTQNKI